MQRDGRLQGAPAAARRARRRAPRAIAAEGSSFAPSVIDERTEALVRVAATIAVDAAPSSFQHAVALALAAGATSDEIVASLEAVTPVTGAARVVRAPRSSRSRSATTSRPRSSLKGIAAGSTHTVSPTCEAELDPDGNAWKARRRSPTAVDGHRSARRRRSRCSSGWSRSAPRSPDYRSPIGAARPARRCHGRRAGPAVGDGVRGARRASRRSTASMPCCCRPSLYTFLGSSRQLIVGPEGPISALVAARSLPLAAAGARGGPELAAMLALLVGALLSARLGDPARLARRLLLAAGARRIHPRSRDRARHRPARQAARPRHRRRRTARAGRGGRSASSATRAGRSSSSARSPSARCRRSLPACPGFPASLDHGRRRDPGVAGPSTSQAAASPSSARSRPACRAPAFPGAAARATSRSSSRPRSASSSSASPTESSRRGRSRGRTTSTSTRTRSCSRSPGMAPWQASRRASRSERSGSRTAVNDQMGGRTQFAGLVAAGAIALVLLFLTDAVSYLPVAVLGAVIVSAAIGLVDPGAWRALARGQPVRGGARRHAPVGVVVLGVLQALGSPSPSRSSTSSGAARNRTTRCSAGSTGSAARRTWSSTLGARDARESSSTGSTTASSSRTPATSGRVREAIVARARARRGGWSSTPRA